jgi:hypothetical protein
LATSMSSTPSSVHFEGLFAHLTSAVRSCRLARLAGRVKGGASAIACDAVGALDAAGLPWTITATEGRPTPSCDLPVWEQPRPDSVCGRPASGRARPLGPRAGSGGPGGPRGRQAAS